MNNEQLILNRLLEIQEDIGGMKSAQDNCDDKMISLEDSIKEVRKHCDDAITVQISKKQMIVIGGTIITAIAGWFGLGGVQ